MKIEFKKDNVEQLALIRQMGDKNPAKAREAQEAFATLLMAPLGSVYLQADTTSLVYRDLHFDEDTDPTFPLEIFADVPVGYFTIWSQAMPGGLPTNTVVQPISEYRFTTYKLDSAISYLAKYARNTRLPVIERALERLVNEILIKTQTIAWSVLFAALAGAVHNGRPHIFQSETPGVFTLDDYNKLLTFFKRLNKSFVGGTPVGGATRPTDMIISPEMMEKFRAMAYNPINTKAPTGITPTAASGVVTLPDAQRAALYSGAGVPEFYGINLIELLELGPGQPYNALLDAYIDGKAIPFIDPNVAGTETFDPATKDFVLILDATKDFAWRAIQDDADTGSVFTLQPDDQWVQRSEKIGQYGAIQEGRIITDTRPMIGMVV